MSKYKVVKYFTDLQDNGYAYSAGDTFPREGFEVSAERLAELSSDKNKRGIALIEEIIEKEPESIVVPEEPKEIETPAVIEEEPIEEKPVEEKPIPKKSSKKGKGNKDAE